MRFVILDLLFVETETSGSVGDSRASCLLPITGRLTAPMMMIASRVQQAGAYCIPGRRQGCPGHSNHVCVCTHAVGLDAAGTSKRAARRFDVDRDGCLYRVVHRLVMGLHQMAALCVIADSKIVGATSIADETPLM